MGRLRRGDALPVALPDAALCARAAVPRAAVVALPRTHLLPPLPPAPHAAQRRATRDADGEARCPADAAGALATDGSAVPLGSSPV
eukprot:2955530-Pleurochrysis_carterae.AAC.1